MSIIKKIINFIANLIAMPTNSFSFIRRNQEGQPPHTGFLNTQRTIKQLLNNFLINKKAKCAAAHPVPEDVANAKSSAILKDNRLYLLSVSLSVLATFNLTAATNDQFTIMIDPAGDAKHTGRLIQDTLERGISLQCAEQLKAMLMQKFKNVRVILTRVPGETIQPLQNASFANRLGVDLYLSLYFYYEPETPAHVTLYYYLENPVTDAWHKPMNLSFYQVNQAHLLNLKTTQAWGNMILDVLHNKTISKFFKPRGCIGIPFTPLVGIKAPAIAVEVGLKNKQDWQQIIDPLVIAIERIMQ